MTDQIPADKVREIIHVNTFLGVVMPHCRTSIIDQLEALLPAPSRPTLADMPWSERDECGGMQADLAQGDRVVILDGTPDAAGLVQVLEKSLDVYRAYPKEVTPRPDLPRLEWPTNRTTRAVADQAAAEGPAWGDAEELPDFLALGIEAMAQSPEGRAAMHQFFHGQMADICNLFGLGYPEGDDHD